MRIEGHTRKCFAQCLFIVLVALVEGKLLRAYCLVDQEAALTFHVVDGELVFGDVLCLVTDAASIPVLLIL